MAQGLASDGLALAQGGYVHCCHWALPTPSVRPMSPLISRLSVLPTWSLFTLRLPLRHCLRLMQLRSLRLSDLPS